ncbi:molecular chaperone [Pseudomonas syringae pv. actinidiae]|nr:molecular chaperone [Pseudomonas syringae]OZI84691.1 pili assembly chaperone [Pseudomonas avellanae]AKT30732.1 pili assembly chaperone [Pseudomonas syringae pv. actinidiae ICMP 18884]AOE57152.1 pili assembly chaperone [Pseudomonas syringae pv. actinidiae ICMP 18708]APP98110.1 pili assembly chaperone [Pseudomonas syringae pv. actinidiae]APQ03865.1 pili assembly chaperone [Pseudomonas syringae pv. actinidiae]
MFSQWRAALSLTFFVSMTLATHANASVVMNGTRVIFPASANEKTLQFSNEGQPPYAVQIWLDKGDVNSTAATADAPIVANPPVFRINANSGQSVRLIKTANNLPTDRESLLNLNFLQVPALQAGADQANRLLITTVSRLKVFYRPDHLQGDPERLAEQLTFKREFKDGQHQVRVDNPTGYFAVIRDARLSQGDRTAPLAESVVLAPFSSLSWPIPTHAQWLSPASRVTVTLVNDYGADVTQQSPLGQ